MNFSKLMIFGKVAWEGLASIVIVDLIADDAPQYPAILNDLSDQSISHMTAFTVWYGEEANMFFLSCDCKHPSVSREICNTK